MLARQIHVRISQLNVSGNKLGKSFFAVSDYEHIDKISYRFTRVNGRATGDNEGGTEGTISRAQRYAAEIKHGQHVGVGHLILERKAHNVEIAKRGVALKRQQRYAVLAEFRFHVRPRREYPLGRPRFVLV